MKSALHAARPVYLLAAALVAASCVAADPDEVFDDAVDSAEALGPSACAVSYKVIDQWSTGFSAEVMITNQTSAAYNGWALTWTLPSGQ